VNLDKAVEVARDILFRIPAGSSEKAWARSTLVANALIELTTPVEISEGQHRTSWTCPACQLQMFSTYRHCPHCGKGLKWK
jgi:predicted RNA-binding Zn-ribbon protein involved in translation (DUF1610 family)